MLYNIIITPIETIIDWVFLFISRKFSALGIISAVAGVSLAMNFMALPIYNIAEKIQAKERDISKKLAPQIKRIKTAFKGDEQFMMLQAYYKEAHYHPLYVFRSSLSILIEIPFFIAAYHYLSHCDALFGASFWIFKNLGLPDNLFSITLGQKIFYINILPILMTIINFVSGAVYTKDAQPKEKIQLYGIGILFLVLLYNSPSGLVIYWILNNLFSLAKNIVLKCKHPGKIAHAFVTILFAGATVFFFIFKPGSSLWKKWMMVVITVGFALIPYIIQFFQKLPFFQKLINLDLYTDENRKTNRIIFFITIITFVIISGFTLPASTIASSPVEFCFLGNTPSPFAYIWQSVTVFFGFCVFWPLVIYFLFGEKVKRYETILYVALLITVLFNVYVFKPDYGTIDARFTITNRLDRVPFYFNILPIIIFTIVSCLFVILEKYKKQSILSMIILSIGLAGFGLGLYKSSRIKKDYIAQIPLHNQNTQKIFSKNDIKPVLNLSKNQNNVLVIFLDRAISSFFPYIIEQFPELEQSFSGFTYYPNTLSSGIYTSFGYPPMVGGYEYTQPNLNKRPDELLKDKHNEALLVMPTLFADGGYDVTFVNPSYADYKYSNGASFFDKYPYIKGYDTKGTLSQIYMNEKNINYNNVMDIICKKQIVNFVFVEEMYPLIRDIFQKTIRDDSVDKSAFIDSFSDLYYLKEHTQINNEKPTFTFIGNETTHEPTSLIAPEYEVPGVSKTNSTGTYKALNSKDEMEYQVNAGAILQVAKFFNYLKNENVYDNSRIIIVSDHGYFDFISTFPKFKNPTLPASYNPLLLVKDFNSSGQIKTDNTLMTNADTLFLAKEGLNLSNINPFTKKEFKTDKNPFYVWTSNNGESSVANIQNKTQFTLTSGYKVTDNLFDPKNWTEITYKEYLKETAGENQ